MTLCRKPLMAGGTWTTCALDKNHATPCDVALDFVPRPPEAHDEEPKTVAERTIRSKFSAKLACGHMSEKDDLIGVVAGKWYCMPCLEGGLDGTVE